MKSQFKKADASGARYALIFGADELARGEVGAEAVCATPATPQAARRARACRRAGRSPHQSAPTRPHNPGFARRTRHGHPSRPRRAGTARPAEGVLEAVRQPDHLGADPRCSAASRPGTAGTCGSATRASRPARSTTSSTAPRRPATRARDAHLRRPEGALSAHRVHAAGRPARRQVAVREGPVRRRDAPAWPGSPTTPAKTSTARSRACAWPACCSTRRSTTKRSSSSTPSPAGPSSTPWPPTGAATSCWRRARSAEAQAAYLKAWTAMDPKLDYRRLVEAKLNALGVQPAAARRAAPRRRSDAAAPMRGVARAPRRRWPRRWPSAARRLRRVRAAEKPKPTAARADRRADRGPAGLEPAASAAVQFPLTVGRQRQRADAGGERRHRRSRSRPTAAARSGAPTSAPRSRPASAATAAIAAVVTRDSELVALEARPGQVAQALGVARRDRAAGRRRARLRARRRPHRARLRRARRPQAVARAAPRRCADAVADRRRRRRSRTRCRRPGAAPGRHRPAARHACAGKCRSARRAAPTRSSGWPTWSARSVRVGDLVCARVVPVGGRLRRRRSAARSPWTKNVGGTDAIGGDAELLFGADATDRITAWRTASGDVAWTSEKLLYRGLSAPAGGRRSRSCSAMSRARCTSSRANGRAAAAPADRRQRDRRRRR